MYWPKTQTKNSIKNMSWFTLVKKTCSSITGDSNADFSFSTILSTRAPFSSSFHGLIWLLELQWSCTFSREGEEKGPQDSVYAFPLETTFLELLPNNFYLHLISQTVSHGHAKCQGRLINIVFKQRRLFPWIKWGSKNKGKNEHWMDSSPVCHRLLPWLRRPVQ